jgi:hypothetical protein
MNWPIRQSIFLVLIASLESFATGTANSATRLHEISEQQLETNHQNSDLSFRDFLLLRGKITQAAGHVRGNWIIPGSILADELGLALAVYDPRHYRIRRLPDGSTLVTGCRPQSCDEKGAVIIGPDERIRSLALIHYSCRRGGPSETSVVCARTPKLSLFLTPASLGADRATFAAWAARVSPEAESTKSVRLP